MRAIYSGGAKKNEEKKSSKFEIRATITAKKSLLQGHHQMIKKKRTMERIREKKSVKP
ncbi:MAG TPA: hypothetical protein VHF65_09140 [Nitrososphaera sp.]|nr:hypothetical protein [Nitrososphaera sp.]